jgi:hypothetical protein
MRLGRPCVVGAVQVAPTPRIRPRKVPRHGGSDVHGASKSRPSNLKLALVAYWYGLALCAGSSRHIWHIRIVNARPGARTRLRSTGRPLPAYSRRLVSLQATCSLCQAYGMHCTRPAGSSAGMRLERRRRWHVRASPSQSLRSDRGHRPERLPLAACSRYLGISCMSADPRAPGCRWATAVARSSHT